MKEYFLSIDLYSDLRIVKMSLVLAGGRVAGSTVPTATTAQDDETRESLVARSATRRT